MSSSTVRYELAVLEEQGLLTHPHTSAGRVPTDAGYRLLRRPAARPARAASCRPRARPLGVRRARSTRRCARRRRRSRDLTHLLALVSAPPLETTIVRHVEVLLLQPQVVMVVVITSTGGVTKRLFTFEEPVDAGLAEWAAQYLNETLAGLRLGARLLAQPLRGRRPLATASERSSSGCVRRSPTSSRRRSRRSTSAGRPACWTSSGPTSCARTGACSRCSSSGRPCSTSCGRASARSGRSSASGRISTIPTSPESRSSAPPYGLQHRNLGTVSLLGPDADGLREGDRGRACGRARALALRRGALRGGRCRPWPMATTTRLLRDPRRSARRRRARDQVGVPRGSRASCTRTCPTTPRPQERFREAAEAYEVLSKAETRELYDRYGHDGPPHRRLPADGLRLREPQRPLLRVLRRRPLRRRRRPAGRRSARGADVLAEVEVDPRRGCARAPRAPSRSRRRSTARPATARAPRPARSPTTCAGCGGTGRLQTVSSSFFGQIVRTQACPRCGGRGEVVETPCPECDGAGRLTEERELDVEIPPGIHDGQRIRLGGRGARRRSRRARSGDLYVLVHVRPDDALRARGQRHRLRGRADDDAGGSGHEPAGRDARRRARARVRAGDAARGRPRPARQGHARPPGARPRRSSRARQRRASRRHLTDEQRRLLEEFGRSEHERELRDGRRLLREAALRVPLSGLRRVAVTVPAARAEEAQGGDDRRSSRRASRSVTPAACSSSPPTPSATTRAPPSRRSGRCASSRSRRGWEDAWRRVPPARAGRAALDRAAVGAARRRRDRGRHRPGPRLRNGRPRHHAALPGAAARARAGGTRRRRLRLGRARRRCGEARLRPGDRARRRRDGRRGGTRERCCERSRGRRPARRRAGRSPPGRASRRRQHRARSRSKRVAERFGGEVVVASGYLEPERPAPARLAERREADGGRLGGRPFRCGSTSIVAPMATFTVDFLGCKVSQTDAHEIRERLDGRRARRVGRRRRRRGREHVLRHARGRAQVAAGCAPGRPVGAPRLRDRLRGEPLRRRLRRPARERDRRPAARRADARVRRAATSARSAASGRTSASTGCARS